MYQKHQFLKPTIKQISHLTVSTSLIILFWGINSLLYAQETPTEPPTSTNNVIDIGGEQINIDDKLLDDNFYFDLDENLNSGVIPTTTINPEAPSVDKVASNPSQKKSKSYIQIQISNIVYPVTQEKENQYIYITNIILDHQTNIVYKTNQIDEMKPDPPYIDLGYEFVRVRRMISKRQYEQALLLLTQIELASPNNTRVYNIRGSIYYKLGFYNYAVSNWEKSLTINPNQLLVKRYIDRLKTNPTLHESLNQPTQ